MLGLQTWWDAGGRAPGLVGTAGGGTPLPDSLGCSQSAPWSPDVGTVRRVVCPHPRVSSRCALGRVAGPPWALVSSSVGWGCCHDQWDLVPGAQGGLEWQWPSPAPVLFLVKSQGRHAGHKQPPGLSWPGRGGCASSARLAAVGTTTRGQPGPGGLATYRASRCRAGGLPHGHFLFPEYPLPNFAPADQSGPRRTSSWCTAVHGGSRRAVPAGPGACSLQPGPGCGKQAAGGFCPSRGPHACLHALGTRAVCRLGAEGLGVLCPGWPLPTWQAGGQHTRWQWPLPGCCRVSKPVADAAGGVEMRARGFPNILPACHRTGCQSLGARPRLHLPLRVPGCPVGR